MADEVSYYSDQSGVRVSDKRVIIGNTTYSTANITSVSTNVVHPSLLGPIIVAAIGLFIFVSGLSEKSGGAVVGVIIAALGYFWYKGRKPIWHLRICKCIR